ncbi:MAG: hypothetical protein ABUL55_02760, partial [Pseudomonadota bacterium]
MTAEPPNPFQKAWKALAAGGALVASACVGAALAWNAGLFNSADAASTVAAREAFSRRLELEAFTDVYLHHEAKAMRMGRGDTLASLITEAGGSQSEASAMVKSVANVFDPRQLQAGQPVNLYFDRGDAVHLTGLAFRSLPGASITANRTADGGFTARQLLMPVTYEIARIAAPVRT